MRNVVILLLFVFFASEAIAQNYNSEKLMPAPGSLPARQFPELLQRQYNAWKEQWRMRHLDYKDDPIAIVLNFSMFGRFEVFDEVLDHSFRSGWEKIAECRYRSYSVSWSHQWPSGSVEERIESIDFNKVDWNDIELRTTKGTNEKPSYTLALSFRPPPPVLIEETRFGSTGFDEFKELSFYGYSSRNEEKRLSLGFLREEDNVRSALAQIKAICPGGGSTF